MSLKRIPKSDKYLNYLNISNSAKKHPKTSNQKQKNRNKAKDNNQVSYHSNPF